MCSEGLRERYVNPYTDFAFKLLFGTDLNKEILIGFLNALFDGKQVIEDVTYLNTEHLGSKETDRRAVFDVYCENEKGEKILIEMQRGEQQFFKDRSIYYATYPIREQAIKGEIWDYELKAVYVIGILNFALDDVWQLSHFGFLASQHCLPWKMRLWWVLDHLSSGILSISESSVFSTSFSAVRPILLATLKT